MRKKLLGLEHPDVVKILNNLVELYQRQWRYEDVKKLILSWLVTTQA